MNHNLTPASNQIKRCLTARTHPLRLAAFFQQQAVVPATEAARARAAVASALLAGAKPDNNLVAGAVPVGAATGGVAAMPCRSTSPRPAPPRNFKAKVGGSMYGG